MKVSRTGLALLAVIHAPAALADTARMPGHMAVYELSFASGDSASSIVGAQGRYVFDLEDICEGYTLNERLVVQLERSGGHVLTDYRLSAYESNGGDLYRFATETEYNGETGQEASGTLSTDDGESVSITRRRMTSSSRKACLRPLPICARSSRRPAPAMSATPRMSSTAISTNRSSLRSPRISSPDEIAPASVGADVLADQERWFIDSVYYPPTIDAQAAGTTPEFSFTGVLYENGIITDLRSTTSISRSTRHSRNWRCAKADAERVRSGLRSAASRQTHLRNAAFTASTRSGKCMNA